MSFFLLLSSRTMKEMCMNHEQAMKFLGLRPGQDVKKAYLALAKKYHPDMGGDVEMFVRVREAYDRLAQPIPIGKGRPKGHWSETTFQTWFQRRLRGEGAFVINIHGHAAQMPGVPDLYVAHYMFVGWIELKVRAGKLTPGQRRVMTQLKLRDVNALTARLLSDSRVELDLDPVGSGKIYDLLADKSYICQLNQLVDRYDTAQP